MAQQTPLNNSNHSNSSALVAERAALAAILGPLTNGTQPMQPPASAPITIPGQPRTPFFNPITYGWNNRAFNFASTAQFQPIMSSASAAATVCQEALHHGTSQESEIFLNEHPSGSARFQPAGAHDQSNFARFFGSPTDAIQSQPRKPVRVSKPVYRFNLKRDSFSRDLETCMELERRMSETALDDNEGSGDLELGLANRVDERADQSDDNSINDLTMDLDNLIDELSVKRLVAARYGDENVDIGNWNPRTANFMKLLSYGQVLSNELGEDQGDSAVLNRLSSQISGRQIQRANEARFAGALHGRLNEQSPQETVGGWPVQPENRARFPANFNNPRHGNDQYWPPRKAAEPKAGPNGGQNACNTWAGRVNGPPLGRLSSNRRRAPSCTECAFCRSNNQPEHVYKMHILKVKLIGWVV